MRVISGKYKGRKIFLESKSNYRPTLTRIREDIFNLLSHNNNLDVNLNNVKTLMGIYPDYPIGFSDHTLGTAIPLASVALGVCLIEKHFTLDKNMEGWDHKVSATKDEMKEIVENALRVSKAMGSFRITATESNEKKREFRRSIVLTRGINKGDIITEEMIDFKRPGTGIPPEAMSYIIGKKANRNIAYDEIINLEDF